MGVNARADLLDGLKIDEGLLADPAKLKGKGTLNQLEDALKKELGPEEFERANVGISELRKVVRLRTGLTHAGAGDRLPAAARSLGFDWPAADWGRAWELVRDRATRAFHTIREAIEAAAD